MYCKTITVVECTVKLLRWWYVLYVLTIFCLGPNAEFRPLIQKYTVWRLFWCPRVSCLLKLPCCPAANVGKFVQQLGNTKVFKFPALKWTRSSHYFKWSKHCIIQVSICPQVSWFCTVFQIRIRMDSGYALWETTWIRIQEEKKA